MQTSNYMQMNGQHLQYSISWGLEEIKTISRKGRVAYFPDENLIKGDIIVAGKTHTLTYYGKDIHSRSDLQRLVDQDIARIFKECLPETPVPTIDLSNFLYDFHVDVIKLIKNNPLDKYGMGIETVQYHKDHGEMLYVKVNNNEHRSTEFRYDNFETPNFKQFLFAYNLDLANFYFNNVVEKKGPFDISITMTTVSKIQFYAQKKISPSVSFAHMFFLETMDADPNKRIYDYENRMMKLKLMYEMINDVLKAEGHPQFCVPTDDIQDIPMPRIELN